MNRFKGSSKVTRERVPNFIYLFISITCRLDEAYSILGRTGDVCAKRLACGGANLRLSLMNPIVELPFLTLVFLPTVCDKFAVYQFPQARFPNTPT